MSALGHKRIFEKEVLGSMETSIFVTDLAQQFSLSVVGPSHPVVVPLRVARARRGGFSDPRSFLPKAHMPDMVSVAVSRAKSRGTAFVLFDIKLRRLVSKLRRLSPRARELHSPLSQSCEIVMASSLQGALSVARPPEVSRFGSFVKPTADWF
jgi:hypothetical protein